MQAPKLSYDQTKKLITMIEEKYFSSLTDVTREQFDEWRNNDYTKFRVKKLGAYWLQEAATSQDYLRRKLYQRFNEMNEDRTQSFAPTKTFLAGLKKYFGEDIIHKIMGVSGETISDKINVFKDSVWIYYYYDEFNGISGISTGILSIDSQQVVHIKDMLHERGRPVFYTGRVKLAGDNSLLLFELQTRQTRERDLHILVHIGNSGSKPEIALGQYHNLDDNLTIVSGTIVLADTKKDFDAFLPTFFEKGTAKYHGLKKQVKKYLSEKSGNRIKVPHNIYSYTKLGKWIDDKNSRHKINVANSAVRTFVSAPITSLSADSFKSFQSKITAVKASLEASCRCNCYCALLKVKSQDEWAEHLLFKQIMEELRHCQLFVMVVPPYELERQTSAFIEFGFIYNRKIPVVIFVEKGQGESVKIPNLLRGAANVSSNFISTYFYKDLDEIPEIIKKFERTLFGLS